MNYMHIPKKLTAILLTFVVAMSFMVGATTETDKPQYATMDDALAVLRECVKLPNEATVATHDFNKNEKLDIGDGLLVLRGIVGIGDKMVMGDVSKVEPPVTEPPVTEPPVTEPPVTEPPVTEPPVTEPLATAPPVTEPPVTEPPVTEPPVTEPPVTEPQVTEPPVTVPPTEPTEPVYYTRLDSPIEEIPDGAVEIQFRVVGDYGGYNHYDEHGNLKSDYEVLATKENWYMHHVGLYIVRTYDELLTIIYELDSIPKVFDLEQRQSFQFLLDEISVDVFSDKAIILWHGGRIRHDNTVRMINSVSFIEGQLIVSSIHSPLMQPPLWAAGTLILIEVDNDSTLDEVTALIPYDLTITSDSFAMTWL